MPRFAYRVSSTQRVLPSIFLARSSTSPWYMHQAWQCCTHMGIFPLASTALA